MNERKFDNLSEMVEQILSDDLNARNSNNALYAKVLQRLNAPSYIVNGILALDSKRLPSLETVTRARRKVVSEHPNYKGKKSVEEHRFSLYKFYKRGGGC